jgi:predicted PhzF superfamily epimerase YddE/YHI9
MKLPLYQVDAFTDAPFGGNPAAVCPLEAWLPDATMQAIALENNLSETAFFVREGDHYRLRWFTPQIEVNLCGHATLASAFVLYECLGATESTLEFETKSGRLRVAHAEAGKLAMDLPAWMPEVWDNLPAVAAALRARPGAAFKARDGLALFASESEVLALAPDFAAVKELDCLGLIATAPAGEEGVDFVSRFFAPGAGIDEDPVTGSAHCTLTPFWAERLGKNELVARQISARGGELFCRLEGERVEVAGRAILYLEGLIEVPG